MTNSQNFDRLSEMMEIQEAFTSKVVKNKYGKDIESLTIEEIGSYIKDVFTHLIVECTEVLNEIPWKMHKRPNYKEIDREKIKEELVDIDKFHKNFLVILSIGAEEYYDKWLEKSKKVEERFNEENQIR